MHVKHLLLDNFYLIKPLIRKNPVAMQTCLKYLLQIILTTSPAELGMARVNNEALFNDQTLVNDWLAAFLSLLIENSSGDAKCEKFLYKLLNFTNGYL